MAVAEASLRMLKLSMSFGLIEFRAGPSVWSMGTPSITYSGLLLPSEDTPPRIFTVPASPGLPLGGTTFTPAVLPVISCSGEAMSPTLNSFSLTCSTAPVASFLVV